LNNPTREIAASAARLVVEEGLEYGPAKRRAARDFGRRAELPDNETVEEAVREYLALFCADTQPTELRALRKLALTWMHRLATFRPHLAGAAWRGTATRLSPLLIDLYCDDPKSAEIALINLGIRYESAGTAGSGDETPVLTLSSRSSELGDPVTVHLLLHDHDELRGALKADNGGRSWRGDAAALERLLRAEGGGAA
jgi:hypothetical protein